MDSEELNIHDNFDIEYGEKYGDNLDIQMGEEFNG